jgi:hypothetical protein
VREAFATLPRGDLDWLQRQYLAQDIRCHFLAEPLAGDYEGVSRALGFSGRAFELSGGPLRLEVRDVLASDEHAVTLATVHGGRAGGWSAMASLSPTSPMASRPRPGGRHETSR